MSLMQQLYWSLHKSTEEWGAIPGVHAWVELMMTMTTLSQEQHKNKILNLH